jgi:hypothetical protein
MIQPYDVTSELLMSHRTLHGHSVDVYDIVSVNCF